MNEVKNNRVTFRLKKDEDTEVLSWLKKQTNASSAIKALIKLEVKRNGLYDLSERFPMILTDEFLEEYIEREKSQY